MRNTFALIFLILIITTKTSHAESWGPLSDQASLKNHVILEAGDASEVEPPYGVKWSSDVFQMNNRCFIFQGFLGYWGYGSKPAFLLVSEQRNLKIAIFESSAGSIKVELKNITLIQCPR